MKCPECGEELIEDICLECDEATEVSGLQLLALIVYHATFGK